MFSVCVVVEEAGDVRLSSETTPTSSQFAGGVDDSRNDPSAGSPTETLLRLLLPLNDKV